MILRLAFAAVLFILLSGCGALVVGPAQVSGEQRTVYLLDHGRHSTLLLTAADQSRLRYAYADWAWYVDEDAGLKTGFDAMVRASRAALGRQRLAAAQPGENLASVVGVGIEQAYAFQVDAARVDELVVSLEHLYHSSTDEPHHSSRRNLSFVEYPQAYRFSQNSNHKVAAWLGKLGVSVSGNPAIGRWRVEPPR